MTCLSHRPLVAELGLSLPDDIQVLPLASLPGGYLLLLRLATPPLAAFVPF